jgi:hypothetical protein
MARRSDRAHAREPSARRGSVDGRLGACRRRGRAGRALRRRGAAAHALVAPRRAASLSPSSCSPPGSR